MPLWSKLLWDKGAKVTSGWLPIALDSRTLILPVIALIADQSRVREGRRVAFQGSI